MALNQLKLIFSCIIIVFSFEGHTRADEDKLKELHQRYEAGEINDLKLLHGIGKEMRRDVRHTQREYEREVVESSFLTCEECQQVNELAFITTRALLETKEVKDNETLTNEVQYLKAITLYRHHIDGRFDEICDKRNFYDQVEINPQPEDERTIIFNSKLSFLDIDALGIKRAYRGLTFYFGRPPFVNGEPQTIVKVFIPQAGDGEVTIYKRKFKESENSPGPKKTEVTEEPKIKDKKDENWSYQYATPGFKLGPSVEFDSNNLPKKLTIMEFEDETELAGLEIKTKSEISTRRQKATVDFDWNKDNIAQVEIKGNGKARLKIPTQLNFFDFDMQGAYGINGKGDQTMDINVDYDQMRLVSIEYEREDDFERVSFSREIQLEEDTKVMLRYTQTEDERQSTLQETGGNYDKSSLWIEFSKRF